jgi:hypothetical protein
VNNQLDIYEIRLREEFNNLRKLQRQKGMESIFTIQFVDRINGGKQSIDNEPSSNNLFPEEYIITYKMPIYIERGRLDTNWSGDFEVTVSKDLLMRSSSSSKPTNSLDTSNGVPFNHHIGKGFFCIGGVWSVAKDFGIWYFIVGIGGVLNQEKIWMEDNGEGHMNREAYDYWKNARNKEPINDIKWPYTLEDDFKVVNQNPNSFTTSKFKIGKTENKPVVEKKPLFKIKK